MANYVLNATKDQVHSQMLWTWPFDVAAGDVLDDATSGDLCIIVTDQGEGFVGIAENDWDGNREKLVLSWGCIYRIPVTAIDDNGDAAIIQGSKLFWDAGKSRVDMERADTGIYVGVAMEALAAGTSDEIAVLIDQCIAETAV